MQRFFILNFFNRFIRTVVVFNVRCSVVCNYLCNSVNNVTNIELDAICYMLLKLDIALRAITSFSAYYISVSGVSTNIVSESYF